MDYREFTPRRSLQPLVRCYWTLSAKSADVRREPEPALPDGSPELIFNFGDPFQAISAGAANLKTCQNGKFHGMMARTTPSGSNAT